MKLIFWNLLTRFDLADNISFSIFDFIAGAQNWFHTLRPGKPELKKPELEKPELEKTRVSVL